MHFSNAAFIAATGFEFEQCCCVRDILRNIIQLHRLDNNQSDATGIKQEFCKIIQETWEQSADLQTLSGEAKSQAEVLLRLLVTEIKSGEKKKRKVESMGSETGNETPGSAEKRRRTSRYIEGEKPESLQKRIRKIETSKEKGKSMSTESEKPKSSQKTGEKARQMEGEKPATAIKPRRGRPRSKKTMTTLPKPVAENDKMDTVESPSTRSTTPSASSISTDTPASVLCPSTFSKPVSPVRPASPTMLPTSPPAMTKTQHDDTPSKYKRRFFENDQLAILEARFNNMPLNERPDMPLIPKSKTDVQASTKPASVPASVPAAETHLHVEIVTKQPDTQSGVRHTRLGLLDLEAVRDAKSLWH